MTPFRYVLVGYALLFPLAYSFLIYQQPTVSKWLYWVALICVIPFVVASLVILFWGDRKSRLLFFVAWLWNVLLSSTPIGGLGHYVAVLGFRIHVWNIEDYVSSKCELVEFVERGTKHAVGRCDTFSDGSGADFILYDSSGEIVMPVSRRSSEWRDAMYYFPPKAALRDGEGRANHLFGNFYVVPIADNEFDGDSAAPPSRKTPQH